MQVHNYLLIDQKICQLANAIETNILSYTNPQNLEEQKKLFFEYLQKNEKYNPFFTYFARNPIYSYFTISPTFNTYKNELKELLNELGQDSLGLIFEKKIMDLFERMELIRSVGTENFSGNSESYYGSVDQPTHKIAKEFLLKKVETEEKEIRFEYAKQMIEYALRKKKIRYSIKQRATSSGAKFSVNIRTKEILVNKDIRFSESSIKRLIAHEIEGHAFRYENGAKQPYGIFARGLSKETLETEEGIAIYIEQNQGINVDTQIREYSGRVHAIATAAKHSFYETFEEMQKYFSQEEAFNLTLRAKRGTWKQEMGGAFTKDCLYLKGMLTVREFLEEQEIEKLYYGRYSVNDTPLVLDVDGLVMPKYLPAFLKNIRNSKG